MSKYEKCISEIVRKYGITSFDMQFIRHNENITYRVTNLESREEYLLRIHVPRLEDLRGVQHTIEGLLAEMQYLNDLQNETDFNTPRPILNIDNSYISSYVDSENSLTLNCTMLSWIHGTDLTKDVDITELELIELGKLVANIHINSIDNRYKMIRPVYSFEKYDLYISRLEIGVDLELYSKMEYNTLKKWYIDIRQTLGKFPKTASNYGIIHADLIKGNIIKNNDILSIIDFSFSGYGFYMYDLALLLSSFTAKQRVLIYNGYSQIKRVNKEDYNMLEPFFIMIFLGSLAFNISNIKAHQWIKTSVKRILSTYMKLLVKEESFLFEID